MRSALVMGALTLEGDISSPVASEPVSEAGRSEEKIDISSTALLPSMIYSAAASELVSTGHIASNALRITNPQSMV